MKARQPVTCFALVLGLALFAMALAGSSLPAAAQVGSNNLIVNSDFSGGESWPWVTSESWPGNAVGDVVGGEFCVTVDNVGEHRWDTQARQRRLQLQAGHRYTATFDAHLAATSVITQVRIRAQVAQSHDPYNSFGGKSATITGTATTTTFSFNGPSGGEKAAEFTFHLGGASGTPPSNAVPFIICFDNITLIDAAYTVPPIPTPDARNVRVNHVGYFAYGPKKASVANASSSPLTWELKNNSDVVMASGSTTVFGPDASSGDNVHIIDFSSYSFTGTRYTLVVGSDTSHPFDIKDDLYTRLPVDAMSYFYQSRSGMEVSSSYVSDPNWSRPPAHVNVSPNTGDQNVPCISLASDKNNQTWNNCTISGTTPLFTPGYSRTVTGGWYDAGDHGKYVVNGGIAVWTLLNQYERDKHLGTRITFGDGSLYLPEFNNGVPDVLDEARWEMEFLLRMQVPDGQTLAGMAHHKIHDGLWTDMPMRPEEDAQDRYLYPPSTAATLNLAATAAQCARIWTTIDPALSAACLTAAQKAWTAANAHSAMYAADNFFGGGPYDDADVSDEFYWAAAELYITTGDAAYQSYLQASPYYQSIPTSLGVEGSGSMTWKDTAALGNISLAVVPNSLGSATIAQIRSNVVAAADTYVANQQTEGYGTPYKAGSAGYAWGSNSFVLNNAMIMALAYDFGGAPQYLDGVVHSMDYLLGRNALDRSYISSYPIGGSDYGENGFANPHHRFWAYQAWPDFPKAPPGLVSGGPNSTATLDDDAATRAMNLRARCQSKPQTCYADDIDAYSVNEITINWNAPLAWVAAYLDGNRPAFSPCSVEYTIRQDWGSGFTTDITVTNHMSVPVNGWALAWTFPGSMNVTGMWPWNANLSRSGANVSLTNQQHNPTIAANGGMLKGVGFNANYSGVNQKPAVFTLNGMKCNGGTGGGTPPGPPLVVQVTKAGPSWPEGGRWVYLARINVTNRGSLAVSGFDVTVDLPAEMASSGIKFGWWDTTYTLVSPTRLRIQARSTVVIPAGQTVNTLGYIAYHN